MFLQHLNDRHCKSPPPTVAHAAFPFFYTISKTKRMRSFLFNKKSYSSSLLAALLCSMLTAQAQDPQLGGTVAFCKTEVARSIQPKSSTALKSVAQNTTVFSTDFVSAGVGGLRNVGSG